MLPLLLALALAQCSKDTDCKGDRVCTAGACVDPSPLVPREQVREEIERDRLTRALNDSRDELQRTNPVSSVALIIGGAALGGVATWLVLLYAQSKDEVYATIGGSALVGGAVLLIAGFIQLGLRIHARSRLRAEIAQQEVLLNRLNAPERPEDRIAAQLSAATGCPREYVAVESTGPGVIRYRVCQALYVCGFGVDAGNECQLAQ